MIYAFRQFNFGIRVFFNRLSIRNYLKIIKFLWKRYILGKPIPFSVVFALTYKCQCNCLHCFVDDYKRENEDLSTEEIKSVIDFINLWGPVKVTFFGGEPLLNKDIAQLVNYASGKGIRVSIDTNGLLLNEDMVVALKKSGIANINVSIDSGSEHSHNSLRQKEGCFQSAVKGLKLCVKHKIPCLVSTYASKRAIKEKDLESIINLSKRIGASGVKILFPILSGKWRRSESEKLNLKEEEYLKSILDPAYVYIEDALEMVKKKGKGCSAIDRNLIYISPYGDIQPCPAIPITFGNLRRKSIDGIIKEMSKHIFYKKYKSCKICLMNEQSFREKYFSVQGNKELPLDVNQFKL
ncbi:MAG: radical SAM protein [Candidatus Omnitrophota bacterium]